MAESKFASKENKISRDRLAELLNERRRGAFRRRSTSAFNALTNYCSASKPDVAAAIRNVCSYPDCVAKLKNVLAIKIRVVPEAGIWQSNALL
jgi:hypothetical protein